jgi:hypothetical protein
MSTNPVDELGDSTREERPVDNSPRYWANDRSGVVHRNVRWAVCADLLAPASTTATIPDGPRCRTCFPIAEVVVGRTMTGWPR